MSAMRLPRLVPASLLLLLLCLSGCDCSGPVGMTDGGPLDDGAQPPIDAPALPDGRIPGADSGRVDCGDVVCAIGERCDTSSGTPTCVPATCEDLMCSALERCVPAPSGTGFVCEDATCTDSADCDSAEYCDGTVCVPDVCVPGATECGPGGEVRECSGDGGEAVARFTCGGDAYFTSTCTESADGAYCPCEDDWDCPPFTACEAGRCEGTGAMPTCRLPAEPFASVLPAMEPGFPWGGASPSSRNATGSPFPASAQVVMTPLVANLDDDNGDGLIDERDTPEIVFLTFCNSEFTSNGVLRAVHGGGPSRGGDFFASCGTTRWNEGDASFPTCGCNAADLDSTAGLAAGDIDGDGVPEIVAITEGERLRVYSNTGEILVADAGAVPGPNGSPAIANLDGAGPAEVVVGNVAFTFERDASGALARVDRFTGTLGDGTNGQGPIACVANVAGGGELEVIGGSTVYRLPAPPAGVTRRADCAGGDTSDFCAGALSVVWDARMVNGTAALREGFCAVADVLGADPAADPGPMNPLDGTPEVIVVASGRLQIFEGATGTMRRDLAMGIGTRGGAPNVDDFDGDGFPEIGTAGSTVYRMIDLQPPTALCPDWPNVFVDTMTGLQGNPARTPPAGACASDADCGDLAQLACNEEIGACVCLHNGWRRRTEDDSSQVTGSSVFDFNGDGAAEVVYNDECYFRVYDGTSGDVLFRQPSESRTRTENPVVADVDNDGNAEIVFATSNESGFCSDRTLAPMFNNGVEVWGDTTDRWVSARRIWNEHAYHVTNVLESGGVPVREPESWRPYGGRQYNTYRSQPRSFGIAPNLVVEHVQISSPGAMCGALGTTLQITARIANRGDLRVGPDVVVAFEGIWLTPPLTEPLYADAAMTPLTATLGRTLEPGATVLVTVTFDPTFSTPGTRPDRVRVVVDALMAERECLEDDNTREADVSVGDPAPDLVVELGVVGGACPTRTFETTVRNLGGVEARDVVVRYYVGDPTAGGTAIHDELVPGPIPPGGMVTFTASVAFPTRSAFVYAVVDPDDRVFECDDANNADSTDERIECGPS